jgi:hypothetical protein
MSNERERLQANRDRLAAKYNQHTIDWGDPESVKESSRRYNEFHKAAARLDRN